VPAAPGSRAAVALFLASALVGVWLSANIASGRPILASRWSLLAELLAWSAAWLVGVAATRRLPARVALGAVLVAALALRVAALAGPPTTSDDLYRYSWDGRVQAAGADPYAQPPASPSLVHLREAWLWPDAAGCRALAHPAGCTRINRSAERTIYPPVAEAWFAAVYRATGIGARHKAWQVSGLLTEMGSIVLIALALRRWHRDPRWAALYALCPAPVLEFVNNAHVDGLALLFAVAALVVVVPPEDAGGWLTGWWRDVAFGGLIGAALLVKLYPALLLVAVVGTVRGRRLPALVRAGATAAALTAVVYLPHVLAVGPRVLGYLPGYLREEHYNGGGRFLLAGTLGVPGGWAGALSAAVLLAVVAWVVARRPPVPDGAVVLLGTLLLAATPVQPWYAVSLVAFAAAAARPWWVAVTAAGYPYFFATILADDHVVGIGRLSYGAALVLVVGVWAVRARRRGSAARPGQGAGVGFAEARQGPPDPGSRNWSSPSAVPATTT